jgi:hypothetical protein
VAIASYRTIPLAAGRVATRICSGNLPLLPLLPLITHHAARATEPETTGRVCWPVIVCYSGLTTGRMQRGEYRRDHGADAMGVFGAEPAGRKVAPVKRGHRYRDGSGRTERGNCRHLAMPTWHYPLRYRTANAPRSCSELASRYQAALSRRIRGSYTIRPVTGGEFGPDCGGHPPRYRQRNRARLWRASAPLPTAKSGQAAASIRPAFAASWRPVTGDVVTGSVIGTSAPSAELATKSGTIRPAIGSETADVAGSIRPVIGRRIRGNWRAVSARGLPGIFGTDCRAPSAPWSRSVFPGSIRPEIGQPIRGARESIIRPAIASEFGEADRHYPPRYRRCWRPVTAPVATIPLAFGPFASAPGNP